MGFLNPWVLGALAAVAAPIAIHLLNKFRVRQTEWAAMRFVLDSLKRNRRRLELEDLLLLILRCLAVVLLALAFARPVLRQLISGDATDNGPMTAVILLDNSASMGQSNGVERRFDLARNAIREWIGKLESGSELAFYLVANRADAMVAKPSPDLARIRRSLDLAELSDRSTDLAKGIVAAYKILQPLTAQRREIHVYTDSQQPAWNGLEEITRLQRENRGIILKTFVQGAHSEDNFAVTGLIQEGGIPAINQPCRFRVNVANFGKEAAQNIRVTVAVDNQPPSAESLIPRIEPGSTQSTTLFVRLAEAGFHTIEATVPADRLPIDNQRTTAVRVVDRLRTLIVEGQPLGRPSERSGFFLANALAPVSTDHASGYYLNVQTTSVAALAKTDLAPYGLLFLCDPGAPDSGLTEKLRAFVERGGGLVLFPGPNTDSARWRSSSAAKWLPAIWGERKNAEKSKPVHLQGEPYPHPVTAIWNDPTEGSLAKVGVNSWFTLIARETKEKNETPQIVLRMADGSPAVVEAGLGAGRIAIFNSTATPTWNNLPLHPGFVPLMQRLAGYLEGRNRSSLVLAPGQSFEMEVPVELLNRDFSIMRLGAKERRPAGRVERDADRALIRYRDTEKAGAYRIFLGQENRAQAAFAVQLDPTESDLRQLPAEDLKKLEQSAPVAEAGAANKGITAPQMRVSHEFWAALIWAAALAVLAEMALAHHFSRAR